MLLVIRAGDVIRLCKDETAGLRGVLPLFSLDVEVTMCSSSSSKLLDGCTVVDVENMVACGVCGLLAFMLPTLPFLLLGPALAVFAELVVASSSSMRCSLFVVSFMLSNNYSNPFSAASGQLVQLFKSYIQIRHL